MVIFLYLITGQLNYPATVQANGAPPPLSENGIEYQVAPIVEQIQATENQVVCSISNLYPPEIQQWCGLITQAAAEQALPADLIAAVIWQESGGDPLAYSRSGAVGLMQVMPRDGLASQFMCKNGPCFADRPAIAELQDPNFNVAYGTRMLARLFNRSGSFREALKSYGPMDVGYSYADLVLNIFQRHSS